MAEVKAGVDWVEIKTKGATACVNCKWFAGSKLRAGARGECRLGAPSASGFPAVFPHDWCGKFEAKARGETPVGKHSPPKGEPAPGWIITTYENGRHVAWVAKNGKWVELGREAIKAGQAFVDIQANETCGKQSPPKTVAEQMAGMPTIHFGPTDDGESLWYRSQCGDASIEVACKGDHWDHGKVLEMLLGEAKAKGVND
jgi:hypothetical protein